MDHEHVFNGPTAEVQAQMLRLQSRGFREVPWKSTKHLKQGEFMRTQQGSERSFEPVDMIVLIWLEQRSW